jgi:rRNA-processing protein FCF1
MTTTVAVDTSALMMPVERNVRLFDELDRLVGEGQRTSESTSGDEPRAYECVVPRAVCEELAELSRGNGAEATAASVGADLADQRCRTVDHDESYADDALVELGPEFDAVVTNDGPLRERLLDVGVPVIHIRGRNKLAVTQP